MREAVLGQSAAPASSGANKAQSAAAPPLMTVLLQYLPALKLVTAHAANPADNALLRAVFPGDDGATVPLEGVQQLQRGTFRYSATRIPRPYRCAGVRASSTCMPLPAIHYIGDLGGHARTAGADAVVV